MKHKFFWKNFYRIIAPILIPLILLCSISVSITYNYAITQTNLYSLDMLRLARENLELMLSDIDFLAVALDNNVSNVSAVKSILRSPSYSYDMSKNLEFIIGLIATPTNSKPFIHSIYVYIDNPNRRFLSSNTRIASLDNTHDNEWYNSYMNTDPGTLQWVEARHIKSYTNDASSQPVITLYRRLINCQGVIVLNIRQSYFYKMIGQLARFDDSSLAVVDTKGKLLFTSMPGFSPSDSGLDIGKYPVGKPVSILIDGKSRLMTMLKSDKFNWTYISFILSSDLYSIPERILILTLAILCIVVIAGLNLAYSLTRKNYRQIENIIDVFQAAEKGKPLPPISESEGDEYSYILQSALKTFIEQDYLKMQLSLKQLSLKNAELLALQSQLNPHFMFNTLEAVNLEILSLTKKPTSANRMISQLALLLRYALDTPCGTVTLREEIENTKRYLEIQAYRYEENFFVRWNVDDTALDFQVIPLMLQPLVENCIYHGINKKEGRCGIKLGMQRESDGLHIRITDNGQGIKSELLADIRHNLSHHENNSSKHIGLYNANKRLALTYGQKYRISIRSRYTVGTYIHIFLPDIGTE